MLLVGEILCGLPWGVFFTIAPAYASEVCPVVLRGLLTGYINLWNITGQLLSAGVLDGLVNVKTQWSYRIPFAIQWIWPVPLFLIILFAPESPWWLVRKGRIEAAERALGKLSSKPYAEIKKSLALIIHTTNFEEELNAGRSYLDCFRGTNLRRTEISCMVFLAQTLGGMDFALNNTYFFEQAGLSPSNAYKVNVGGNGLAFISTLLGSVLIAYVGRRPLFLGGMIVETIILLIVGILSVTTQTRANEWAQVVLSLVWVSVFDLSIGTTAYTISSEVSAVGLRVKTVSVAKNAHNLVNMFSAVLEQYMMNPTKWNWKGKTAFFWLGTSVCVTVWTYFRLPELKGRTYEELDSLFDKRVSARKFNDYQVDGLERGPGDDEKGD